MQEIPLQAIPNQRFSVAIAGVNWQLTLKVANQTMFCDIEREGEILITGMRLVANTPIIPYRYLNQGINVMFLTEHDALPWYEEFTKTQSLVYWSEEDGSSTNKARN